MIRHPSSLGVLLFAAVSTSAVAQRVWIVDPVNAVGAHFPDLPQALGSPLVIDGDVLLLRAPGGTYSSASTNKGVSIVAPAGATIGAGGTALTVSNLPAGRHFSLRHVQLNGLPLSVPLVLLSCAGTVHLDTVMIPALGLPVQNGGIAGMSCSGCSAVTVQGCQINGKPAILSTTSSISVTSSILVGTDAGPGDMYISPSGAGVLANGSSVSIACSTVRGGSGTTAFLNLSTPGSPAMSVSLGSLAIGGNAATSSFTAGMPVGTELIPAIHLFNMGAGSVAIDPRVPMTSRNGAPAIFGAPANSVHTVAALGASRPASFFVSAKVIRRQSDVVALLVGLPVPPVNGPFGREWLDVGLRWWFAGGVIDATETLNLPITVPYMPLLFGLPVGLQAAVLGGATLEVTNVTVVVLGV
jgi:hypothetical protein